MHWLNQNAAWLQAVGTLLAVAIAIWVPFKIHANEMRTREREVRLKGQAMALLVGPLLHIIEGQIEREGFVRREGPRQIEIPEAILSLSRDLWHMGEAGGNVLQLIGLLQTHNRLLAETVSLPMDMNDEQEREFSRLFHERINFARECLTEAFAAIDVLLNRKG